MLKEKYKKEVVPLMQEKFQYKNIMMVPKIEKVVVNMSYGKLVVNQTSGERQKIIDNIVENLSMITGQKMVLSKAKKSIVTFKIRKGFTIGAYTTLRDKKMYDFLERLINFGLPRTRDFQGIETKKFDKNGNLSIGIKEHISFLEGFAEKIKDIFSFQIIINISSDSRNRREESIELLRLIGFPIKK